MANEISVTTRLSWSKGGASLLGTATKTFSQSGEQAFEAVQIIGTSSETISIGDVTTVGYMLFKNLNATGGADVGISATSPAVYATAEHRLSPGSAIYLETTTASWYAISQSGNSNLLVMAIEA